MHQVRPHWIAAQLNIERSPQTQNPSRKAAATEHSPQSRNLYSLLSSAHRKTFSQFFVNRNVMQSPRSDSGECTDGTIARRFVEALQI
jgi:hypothetical protein